MTITFVSGTVITHEWLNDVDHNTYRVTEFVATQDQTTFSLAATPADSLGRRIVTRNGLLQDSSDYTELTGSLVFTFGLTAGDKVSVRG